MLAAWGRWVYRFRWLVLIISVLSLGPAALLTSQGGRLESAIIPTDSESARALDLMKEELPPSLPSFGLIFQSPSLQAIDPTFEAEVERAVAPLRDDPRVASVHTAYDKAVADSRSISRDGRSTIVKVEIKDHTAGPDHAGDGHLPEITRQSAFRYAGSNRFRRIAAQSRPHDPGGERRQKRRNEGTSSGGVVSPSRVRVCARGAVAACRRPARGDRRYSRHARTGPHYPRSGIRQEYRRDGGPWRRYRLLAFHPEPVSRGSSATPRSRRAGSHHGDHGASDSFLGRYGRYRFVWYVVPGAGKFKLNGPCGRHCRDGFRSLRHDLSSCAARHSRAQGRFLETAVR